MAPVGEQTAPPATNTSPHDQQHTPPHDDATHLSGAGGASIAPTPPPSAAREKGKGKGKDVTSATAGTANRQTSSAHAHGGLAGQSKAGRSHSTSSQDDKFKVPLNVHDMLALMMSKLGTEKKDEFDGMVSEWLEADRAKSGQKGKNVVKVVEGFKEGKLIDAMQAEVQELARSAAQDEAQGKRDGDFERMGKAISRARQLWYGGSTFEFKQASAAMYFLARLEKENMKNYVRSVQVNSARPNKKGISTEQYAEEADEALEMVLKHAPSHCDVRLKVFSHDPDGEAVEDWADRQRRPSSILL